MVLLYAVAISETILHSQEKKFFNTYEFSLNATQITFEGISGSSYTGDIAIDDVSLMEGICRGKI